METRKYLYNHTNQETAYVVNDYPWGFRLRTTIRYWIESKKNKGQRFCSQTINPKTGSWCAPKYSTYSPIVIMYLNDIGHVHTEGLDHNSKEEYTQEFIKRHESNLNTTQKDTAYEILAYQKVMAHVTFTCKTIRSEPVSLFSKDPKDIARREEIAREQEERRKEQEATFDKINCAIDYEYKKMKAVI